MFSLHVGMEDKYSICLYPGTGTVDGKTGDHVIVSPPYNVTRSQIELIVDKTTQVIESYFAEQ
jgi:adenosylmethionine-8-amino-7-oxononanoate aminotransferase